jgi:hypothetical protein
MIVDGLVAGLSAFTEREESKEIAPLPTCVLRNTSNPHVMVISLGREGGKSL